MTRWALLLSFGTLLFVNTAWLQKNPDIEGSGDDFDYADDYGAIGNFFGSDKSVLTPSSIEGYNWQARRSGTSKQTNQGQPENQGQKGKQDQRAKKGQPRKQGQQAKQGQPGKQRIMKEIRREFRDMKKLLPNLASNLSFMEVDVRDMNRNFYSIAGDVRFIKNEVMYIKRQAHVIWENVTDTRRDHKRMNKTLWWILNNVTYIVEEMDKTSKEVIHMAESYGSLAADLSDAVNHVADVSSLSNNLRDMSSEFSQIRTSLDYGSKKMTTELNVVRDIVSHLAQAIVDIKEMVVEGFTQVDYYITGAQNRILSNVSEIGTNMLKVGTQINEFHGNVIEVSEKISNVGYKVGDVGRQLDEMEHHMGAFGTQFIGFLGTVNDNFNKVHTKLGDVHQTIISNASSVRGDIDEMKVQLKDIRKVIAEKCEGPHKETQQSNGIIGGDESFHVDGADWSVWVDNQIGVTTVRPGVTPSDFPSNGIPPGASIPSYPPIGVDVQHPGMFPGVTEHPNGQPPNGYPTTGQPPNGYPTTGQPPNGYPTTGQPPNGYPTTGQPPNGYPTTGQPPNGYPTTGQPPNGYPTTGQPPNGYPSVHPPTAYPYPYPPSSTPTASPQLPSAYPSPQPIPMYPTEHPPSPTPQTYPVGYPESSTTQTYPAGYPESTTTQGHPMEYPHSSTPHTYPTEYPHSPVSPAYPPTYPQPTIPPAYPPAYPYPTSSVPPGYPPVYPHPTVPPVPPIYPHPTVPPGYPPVYPHPTIPPAYPPHSSTPQTYPVDYPQSSTLHPPPAEYPDLPVPPAYPYPTIPPAHPPTYPHPPSPSVYPPMPEIQPIPVSPEGSVYPVPGIPETPSGNDVPLSARFPQGPHGPGLPIGCGDEFTGYCACLCPCDCTCPAFNPSRSVIRKTRYERFLYVRKSCQCLCTCPCQTPTIVDSRPMIPQIPSLPVPSHPHIPPFQPPPTPNIPSTTHSPSIPNGPSSTPVSPIPRPSTPDSTDETLDCCDELKELIQDEINWVIEAVDSDMEQRLDNFKDDLYEFFEGVVRFHVDVSGLAVSLKNQLALAVAGVVSSMNDISAKLHGHYEQIGNEQRYPVFRPPARPAGPRPGINPPEFTPPGHSPAYVPNRPHGRPPGRPQLGLPQLSPNRPPSHPQLPQVQPIGNLNGIPQASLPARPPIKVTVKPPTWPQGRPIRPAGRPRPERPPVGHQGAPSARPQYLGQSSPQSFNKPFGFPGQNKPPFPSSQINSPWMQVRKLSNETITTTTEISNYRTTEISKLPEVAERILPPVEKSESSAKLENGSSNNKKKKKKSKGCIKRSKKKGSRSHLSKLRQIGGKELAVTGVEDEIDYEDYDDLSHEGDAYTGEVEPKRQMGMSDTEIAIPNAMIETPIDPFDFHTMLQKHINKQLMKAVQPGTGYRAKGKRRRSRPRRLRRRNRYKLRRRPLFPMMPGFPFIQPNPLAIRPSRMPDLFGSLPPGIVVPGINGSPYSVSYNDGRGNSWNVNVNRRNYQDASGIKAEQLKISDDGLEQQDEDGQEESDENVEEGQEQENDNDEDETNKTIDE